MTIRSVLPNLKLIDIEWSPSEGNIISAKEIATANRKSDAQARVIILDARDKAKSMIKEAEFRAETLKLEAKNQEMSELGSKLQRLICELIREYDCFKENIESTASHILSETWERLIDNLSDKDVISILLREVIRKNINDKHIKLVCHASDYDNLQELISKNHSVFTIIKSSAVDVRSIRVLHRSGGFCLSWNEVVNVFN
ncbi:TPA: HrpE/YscL family type III secretion apparatus protein [Serratia marcescens]